MPGQENFETRTARAGMSPEEIRAFIGDFTGALVKLALKRVVQVDTETKAFEKRFDEIAGGLDWSDPQVLAQAGIEQEWVEGHEAPHRTLMHPAFVTSEARWVFVGDYLKISMVSEKLRKVLMPRLVRRRRPPVENEVLLAEAKTLNHYLHLVQESGLTGDRIIAYAGDLRTHGQGQNDSGRIGALGAAVARGMPWMRSKPMPSPTFMGPCRRRERTHPPT